MYIYFNGKIVEKDEVRISPYDHGFMYGLGLFETFRVYNGHPFLLDDHLERLNFGLKTLNIEVEYFREEIIKAIQLLTKKNELQNAYIRLNVSAGNGEIGFKTDAYDNPNTIIFIKPMPESNGKMEKKAKILKLPRNTPEGLERLKSHHYLNNVLAKREIGNRLDIEGVFLTKEGFVAEGITSNIFWCKNEVLYTPKIDTGILNGITRQFIISLAHKMGIEVVEGLFKLRTLIDSDEVFITNSIQEIVPISEIENKSFPGKSGSVVNLLLEKYSNYRFHLWSRKEILEVR